MRCQWPVRTACFADAARERRPLRQQRPRREDRRGMRPLLKKKRIGDDTEDGNRHHDKRDEFARMLADGGREPAGGFERYGVLAGTSRHFS